MGTFRRSYCHLHISFPTQKEFTLKGKNLLLLEQILSCQSKHQFGRAICQLVKQQEVTKVIPLSTDDEKHDSVQIRFNIAIMLFYFPISTVTVLLRAKFIFRSTNSITIFSLEATK